MSFHVRSSGEPCDADDNYPYVINFDKFLSHFERLSTCLFQYISNNMQLYTVYLRV
jgi:hypothetical protein